MAEGKITQLLVLLPGISDFGAQVEIQATFPGG